MGETNSLKGAKPKAGKAIIGIFLVFSIVIANAALNSQADNNSQENTLQDQFLFYGPTELVKNQSGQYEILRMPGSGNSASSSQVYDGQDTVVEFITTDEFGNVVDYNVTEPIELSPSDLNAYVFPTVFQPTRVGTFTVQAIIYQEGTPIQQSMILDGETLQTGNQKTVSVTMPSNLLQITNFSIPSQIRKGSILPVSVPVQNTGSLDTNAFLEITFIDDQNNLAEAFTSQTQEIRSGEQKIFQINAQIMVPAGDYNATASVFFDNQKVFSSAQTSVTLGETPMIQAVALPPIVEADSTLNFQVTLHNDTNASLQPVVYAFLLDGNLTEKTFSDSNILLAPNETRAVEFEWLVEQPAKTYTMKTEAWTENSNQTVEQAVQIVDTQPPAFEEISFTPTIWENALLKVKTRLSDFSAIQSAEILIDGQSIPMNKISGADSNAEFAAAITQTTPIGPKNFQITICDEFGNCGQSNNTFSVEPLPSACNGRLALIVQDNDKINLPTPGQEWILDSSQITGCSAEWPTKELNTPPLAVLNRFRPVFWSNANHFSNTIDENEASLLSQFTQNGGRLFIEGSDISSEHAFDEFSETVLKAEFAQEIGQDQNNGPDSNAGTSQAWWNPNWKKRISIQITPDFSASHYQLRLVLHQNTLGWNNAVDFYTNAREGLEDIRFVDAQTNIELPYWREPAADTSDPIDWVRVPSLSAQTTKTIYIYYGNPDANVSSLAQYEQTFDLVDDFSDGEMNNGPLWTQAKDAGNDWTIINGMAQNASSTGTQYASTFAGMANAKIINTRITMRGLNVPTMGFETRYHLFKPDAGFNIGELILSFDPNQRNASLLHVGTGTICQGNYPNGLPDYFTLTRGLYGAFRVYKGEYLICLGVDWFSPNKAFIGFSHAGTGTGQTDDIYTMKFQSSYPTVSVQQQENYFDTHTIQFFATAPQEFSLMESTIDFNFAPYADAVFADQNAFVIAGWNQDNIAIAGWKQNNQDGSQSKTIFMPISLAAFTPQDRNAILNASLEWLNGGN